MKLTWSHLLFLIVPLSLGCEPEETPEPTPITLEDPTLEIVELTAERVKVRWNPVDKADYYQLNTYLNNNGDEVSLLTTEENEVEFEYFRYCGDSVRMVLYATAYQAETDKYFASQGTLKFKMPRCEYELTFKESKISPYCLEVPSYSNGVVVDIKNVTYDVPYDIGGERDPLEIELTSNINTYDPTAVGFSTIRPYTPYYFIEPPFFKDPTLCDNNPNTDIVTFGLSVKYRETGEHIPGSPLQFEAAIN